jgi:hypothetical protein
VPPFSVMPPVDVAPPFRITPPAALTPPVPAGAPPVVNEPPVPFVFPSFEQPKRAASEAARVRRSVFLFMQCLQVG